MEQSGDTTQAALKLKLMLHSTLAIGVVTDAHEMGWFE